MSETKTTESISAAGLAAMKPDGLSHLFHYDDPGEFMSALRHAYWIRQNKPRSDGAMYRIESRPSIMMIIIRVIPKQ